jgi:hypothetical protein
MPCRAMSLPLLDALLADSWLDATRANTSTIWTVCWRASSLTSLTVFGCFGLPFGFGLGIPLVHRVGACVSPFVSSVVAGVFSFVSSVIAFHFLFKGSRAGFYFPAACAPDAFVSDKRGFSQTFRVPNTRSAIAFI